MQHVKFVKGVIVEDVMLANGEELIKYHTAPNIRQVSFYDETHDHWTAGVDFVAPINQTVDTHIIDTTAIFKYNGRRNERDEPEYDKVIVAYTPEVEELMNFPFSVLKEELELATREKAAIKEDLIRIIKSEARAQQRVNELTDYVHEAPWYMRFLYFISGKSHYVIYE